MKRMRSWLKWLSIGMGVKRWILLTIVGVVLVVSGLALALNINWSDFLSPLERGANYLVSNTRLDQTRLPAVLLSVGVVIIVVGLLLLVTAIIQFNRSVLAAVAPDARQDLADRIYQRRSLAQGHRIVVLGGGTGLSTMLRGLKEHTSNIVAVVTVTDNGGSSGRLTRQMGVPPPGDLRNCLVALADAETTLAPLFQFRFEDDMDGLSGHSFGNLFIAAMTEIHKGNYEQAIAATSKVLAIRGRVYPSTMHNVCLLGEMEDGSIVEGETEIAHHPLPIKCMYLRPESAQPLPETLEAIKLADAIILGPGSVYTSVIPNLLVEGIADAIDRSRAVKIYACNVMTQPGETDGFGAADHLKALLDHAPGKKLVDYALVNQESPAPDVLARYAQVGQQFVAPDLDALRALGVTPIAAPLISHADVVRHDPKRLAEAIYRIIL